jgi:hypothetical protein
MLCIELIGTIHHVPRHSATTILEATLVIDDGYADVRVSRDSFRLTRVLRQETDERKQATAPPAPLV